MMRVLAAVVMLVLAGCVSSPPKAVVRPLHGAFALDGRIAVKYDGSQPSSGFHWQHDADSDDILMLAPLGVTVAHIRRDASGASLEASGKRYEAQDSGELMEQAMGWRLPLTGLPYWVMGIAAPGTEASVERDANGQVSTLQQDGWNVRYTAYATTAPDSLPLRMILRHDKVEIRLLIDEWTTK